MALLSQVLQPEELSKLSADQVELLGGVVHSELITNKQVHDAIAPKVMAAHAALKKA